VKIFIDECVDWRLSRSLAGHDVKTARQMGWTEIKNGKLLALAAREFDVFLTVDQNLQYQQNISTFDIAVVVMRARTTRLSDLQLVVPELLEALKTVSAGAVFLVPAD
jgi:hypothetical protein